MAFEDLERLRDNDEQARIAVRSAQDTLNQARARFSAAHKVFELIQGLKDTNDNGGRPPYSGGSQDAILGVWRLAPDDPRSKFKYRPVILDEEISEDVEPHLEVVGSDELVTLPLTDDIEVPVLGVAYLDISNRGGMLYRLGLAMIKDDIVKEEYASSYASKGYLKEASPPTLDRLSSANPVFSLEHVVA